MTTIGSSTQWSEVVRPQVETILRLILRTWDAMPAPPRNELEKPIALKLTARMQNAPGRDGYPFRIVPEYMILNEQGNEEGRLDIAFMQFVCHDSVYFGVECKRLNSLDPGGLRWYHTEYVNEGIARFATSKYAKLVDTGGMVGFTLNGDLGEAVAKVGTYLALKRQEHSLAGSGELSSSAVCPDEDRIRVTRHARAATHSEFVLHHVFLAGDPNAPLRPEPPPESVKAKRKTTPRRNTSRKQSVKRPR